MKVYHDHDKNGSWTEITDIITYPVPNPRLDNIGNVIVVIRDFEGALYATWKDYDFIPMKVEDDSSNVLFRGFLTGKSFKHDQLTLTISGLGVKLEWESFSNNYILEQGKVSSVPAGTNLVLEDLDSNPFTWDADYWNSGEQNKGFLIVDNTHNSVCIEWDASADVCQNGSGKAGTYEGTLTKNDGEWLYYHDIESASYYNATIGLTVDGESISDTVYLQKIEIEYNLRTALELFNADWTYGRVDLQINKDGSYKTIKSIYKIVHYPEDYPDGFDSGWIDSPLISIQESNSELLKYFNKTGANYTSLKGIRIKFDGVIQPAGEGDGQISCAWDFLKVKIYYNTADISPIMKKITDSADSWLSCEGVDDWTATGVAVGDSFKIGESTNKVLTELSAKIGIEIHTQTTLSKYMARWFRGTNGLEVLTAVCDLEGTHWWEDYVNNRIIISSETDMIDSEVDLTQANYGWDWEYQDDCNFYYKVEVFGSSSLGIYTYAEDTSVNSEMVKQIYDESIMTIGDAQEVADTQLAIWKVKRPSIKLSLNGVNADLSVGKTVGLTMVRPTVDSADYPIRTIQRSKFGIDGIKTVISCGLGKSPIQEKLANIIKESAYLARKAHTDRIISTPLGEGAIVTWDSIGGKTGGVEYIITAELVDGQSIDNGIDTLISNHNVANRHKDHSAISITAGTGLTGGGTIAANRTINCSITQYTNAMVEGIINAELVNGQSIDNAIDSLINTHHDADSVDHDDRYYTESEIDAFKLNKWVVPDGAVAMNSHKITGLGAPTENGNALRWENISNVVYDPDTWTGGLNVSTAPSKQTCRDVFVSLTGAVIYSGTWNPANAYPATGKGFYYIVSTDGYHAVDGNTPERWYEIGDWIVWNDTTTRWDILRNLYGDNIIGVSPGDNIQTAIDEIESIGSGVVKLLPGTHTLSATLTVNDNPNTLIKIKGSGDTSVIDCNGNRAAFFVTNCKSCVLEDFKVDCSDVGDWQGVVMITEANNNKCVARNITVVGNGDRGGWGIFIQSDNCLVIECDVSYTQWGIAMIGSNSKVINNTISNCLSGIKLDTSPDSLVSGNHVTDSIQLITIDDDSHRTVVTGNFTNNDATGLFTRAIAIRNTDYCTISGNNCCNNQSNHANSYGTIDLEDSHYNIIDGNNISNNNNAGAGTQYGIKIDATSTGTMLGANVIHGNDAKISNLGTGTGTVLLVADYEADMAIGIANKRWKNCILEGMDNFDNMLYSNYKLSNKSSADMQLNYAVPLDHIIGDKNLVITRLNIGLRDADATDLILLVRLVGWTAYNNFNIIATSGLYRDPAEVIWNFADETIGGTYKKILFFFQCTCTNAQDLDISYVRVEYYYD